MRALRFVHHLIWGLAGLSLAGICACSNDNNTPDTPAPNPAKRISVATWNVHNFFDTVCDSGACGGDNYEPSVSQSAYFDKLNSVVSGIRFINADVMLLQEIENQTCFDDIIKELNSNSKQEVSGVFGEQGKAASMDVGIIVRGQIKGVQKYRDDHPIAQPDGTTKLLARELLQADIVLHNGVELTAFTTHFVSKATDAVGDRRQGEADLTQKILAEYVQAHPERLVVFGGDLNDFPDSPQIQALSRDGILTSVTKNMSANEILTWRNASALDHIFYPSAYESCLKDTRIICDEKRYDGFNTSDHCSVKAVFDWIP